jgi:hypothetical protein
MSSFLSEPGHQHARRLVLRPIEEDSLSGEAYQSVRTDGSGECDQAWELADPWGSDEGPSAALAGTRRVGDVVLLLWVSVNEGAPAGTTRQFVQQLVAALRRTDASMVCSSLDDALVHEELLTAGFVPLPSELDAAHSSTPADPERIILQL